jgi:hypothetical protein
MKACCSASRADQRETSMLRYLFWVSVVLLCTACSDMRLIGKAALRELTADGINVESNQRSYKN